MAELGVAASVLGLLETAISIVGRLRKAREQYKELASVLDSLRQELENAKAIIQVVRDEDSLQTAAVTAQLVDMERLTNGLANFLSLLDPGSKGTWRKFFHQLTAGSKDEKALTTKIDELGRAKVSLIVRIQVAGVGLLHNVGKDVVVNTAVVNRVDNHLRQILGEGNGLKVAKLIENRPPRDDGTVPVSDADMTALGLKGPKTTRIIENNLTNFQALQINGPVGEDIWKSISHLEVRNNKAGLNSAQVNYPVSRSIFFTLLADHLVKYILLFALLYLPLAYLFQRRE